MISQQNLINYIYDPNKVQYTILDNIMLASNQAYTLTDPTNPFNMLLEATVVSSANAAIQMKNTLKKQYPDLATDKNSLYHFLTDDLLINMFAIPSTAKIVFYLNTIEIKQNGVRPVNTNYIHVTIPEFTEVTVANTNFTLLNDIEVRLYDDGTIFAQQLPSNNGLATNTNTILTTAVINDNQNVSWVIVEADIKQVTRKILQDTIVAGNGYSVTTELTNQYVSSEISYKNAQTNGEFLNLNKTHSEEFIDPYVPTVFISNTDTEVTYKIPDVYLINDTISGSINIVQYESKGKIYIPINKYNLADYTVKLGNTGKNDSTAIMSNITLLANSAYPVDGGVDTLPMEVLRDSIIYNTTGGIDLPITDYDLQQKAMYMGFEIFKVLDVITDRLYTASKNLPTIDSNLLNTRANIFFNTATFILSELDTTSNVILTKDFFIIKSGSVFLDNNGKISILNDYEMNKLNSITIAEKVFYYRDKKYYFTPYYYIVDKIDTNISSRIYDLDNPKINNIVVESKNNNITNSISLDKIKVEKTSNSYRITISVIGDKTLSTINQNSLYIQLGIPLSVGGVMVYYYGAYDFSNNSIIFEIDTNFYIDSNNYLHILNGESVLYNKVIDLVSTAEVIIYTKDSSIIDTTNFLKDNLYDYAGVTAVFIKQNINLLLGKNLKYIWNKISNSYTERKYKQYTYNVPMLYKEDVYATDPDTNSIFTPVDTKGNGTYDSIQYNLIHHKGDPVLDSEGKPVYEHKIGDIVLKDNLPVIDQDAGVVRYIDICMIEYEYKLATTPAYMNYLTLIYNDVNSWLLDIIPEFNQKTLENTTILYKSYNSNKNIKISVNNIIYSIPYVVRPVVDIYTTVKSYTELEIKHMLKIIGQVLHDQLDRSTISHTDIKDEIIKLLGNEIVGATISGLDNVGNLEVFNIVDKTARLVLDKKLSINTNNDLIVDYNITLVIHVI